MSSTVNQRTILTAAATMPAIYPSIQVDTSMCQPDQSTGPPTIQQASQPASHPESQQPGNQSPNIRRGDRQLTANVAAGPRTAWQIRLASGIGMVIDPPCNRSANLHLRTTGSPVRRTPVTGLGLAMNCKQPDASSWDAGCMPPFLTATGSRQEVRDRAYTTTVRAPKN